VKQKDNGTYVLLKAHYTDDQMHQLNGNPDQPYDSAWDGLDWHSAGTTTNEHTKLASDHQVTTDLYWNGQPGKPETGIAYYLQDIGPQALAQYKSWFTAGSHMPREWLNHGYN